MKISELIAKPKNWLQDVFARDKDGRALHPDHEDACAFCLRGAFCRAYPRGGLLLEGEAGVFAAILKEVIYEKGYYPASEVFFIYDFNDDPKRTHAQVLEVVKEAERRMEKGDKPKHKPLIPVFDLGLDEPDPLAKLIEGLNDEG